MNKKAKYVILSASVLLGVLMASTTGSVNANAATINSETDTYLPTAPTKNSFKNYVQKSSVNEEIYFPDVNLRQAVKQQLNLAEDEAITTENILELRELRSSDNTIKSLEGLEYAKNLNIITFNNNNISNLEPLAGLDNLYSVGLAQNPELKIDELLKLKHIVELDISNNPTIGDLSKLDQFADVLNWLVIKNNKISNTDFLKNFKQLKNLDITDNLITDFDLSNQSNLQILTASNNPLTNIKVPSTLKQLIMSNTGVSDLSFLSENQNSLINLVMQYSYNLTDISTVSDLPRLQQLTLNGSSKIKDISSIDNHRYLRNLGLNNIDINEQQLESLKSLPNLDLLLLNKLDTYQGDSRLKSIDFLKNLPSVTQLGMNGNSISDLSKLHSLLPNIQNAAFSYQNIILPEISINAPSSTLPLLNPSGKLPDKIQFNTPGELIDSGDNSVQINWNNPGYNSFEFSDPTFDFNGKVSQNVLS